MARKSDVPGRRVQLHRALSKLGWGSRTEAWGWILAGEVCVDGRAVTDPLTWVDLSRQQVTRRDSPPPANARVVLALHKPRGTITTRRDELGRPTVHDLLPTELGHVFAVGRLDADSEGLLIVTSDSALAERLTSPRADVAKTYRVTVAGRPDEGALARLRGGVLLEDGMTRPAGVRLLHPGQGSSVLEVVLTEGRNRQIRRMLRAVGHKVRRLVRVAVGGLALGDLAPGAFRLLGAADEALLLGE